MAVATVLPARRIASPMVVLAPAATTATAAIAAAAAAAIAAAAAAVTVELPATTGPSL